MLGMKTMLPEPGSLQKQFIKLPGDTPQYKNTRCSESTSNKMSDEQFLVCVTN